MKVKELIAELNQIEDKDKEVYMWDSVTDRKLITMVDELEDCVEKIKW